MYKINLGMARIFIINGKPRLGFLSIVYSNIQYVITLNGECFIMTGYGNETPYKGNWIEKKIKRKDGWMLIIRKYPNGIIQYRRSMEAFA